MTDQRPMILSSDEPPPFQVYRPEGKSAIFITCDHAGDLIPRKLGTLGLGPHDLVRHIAWDIGAAGLCRILSERLDATLVTQTYSRLVIDCNRATHRPDSIATRSENSDVPGNQTVTAEEAEARAREVFWPYHNAISMLLDARKAAGRPTILIAMHSFTPVYNGVSRPWQVGLLYNRDARLAGILKEILAEDAALCIGDNQPYRVQDESDYGIPVHGEQRGLPHVEIEMRHDLIETVENQRLWAERWAGWLARAQERDLNPSSLP
ncbi:MAG: N-formylglutamate amidohydrolase [Kiloniellales bacterium]